MSDTHVKRAIEVKVGDLIRNPYNSQLILVKKSAQLPADKFLRDIQDQDGNHVIIHQSMFVTVFTR